LNNKWHQEKRSHGPAHLASTRLGYTALSLKLHTSSLLLLTNCRLNSSLAACTLLLSAWLASLLLLLRARLASSLLACWLCAACFLDQIIQRHVKLVCHGESAIKRNQKQNSSSTTDSSLIPDAMQCSYQGSAR
jgi:hypothetical protein